MLVAAVWMLGALLSLSSYARSLAALRRAFDVSAPLPAALRPLVARVQARCGTVATVVGTRAVKTPCTFGLTRQVVLVPTDLLRAPAWQIEAVLTHSKLEAGKVTYHIDDVVLWEVLDAVDSLTAPQRTAKRLELVTDGCDRRLVLRADRQKLVQVVMNVVSNATKLTPDGGRITLTTDVSTPGTCALGIADTGNGMSPEQLAVVFEPYVQLDSPIAREHRGTGLGMPIVYQFITDHEGRIGVESSPGRGTRVTVVLPGRRGKLRSAQPRETAEVSS
jgi:hypothetical protein